MSHCPNCGSKFEPGKFRCPNCGSLLVYDPRGKGPSFWSKMKAYKNIFILVAIAILIASVRAALVVTNYIFLLLVAVVVVAALVLWLRNRRPRAPYRQNRFQPGRSPQNRLNNSKPRVAQSADPKAKAKVIPFRRKKEDPKAKAKQD